MSTNNIVYDGRDALDSLFAEIYPESCIITISMPDRSLTIRDIEADRAIEEVIQKKVTSKAIPLTLRKRLMYSQSVV